MASESVRLGIDFGTSNTAAVVRWPDGRARTLLFDGSPLLPSAVYAEPDGTLIVGKDAVHSSRLDPARFEPNPKRRIDDSRVLLGGRDHAVQELITAVLTRVRDETLATVGAGHPLDVTMTCPAAWGATRRLALSDAAASAGLGEVRLVAEPVAAATYFTRVLGRDVPIGSVVVVHDFGAGTFDASVVARTAEGFEVLALDGRDDIGGLDIDSVLVAQVGQLCASRDPGLWQRLEAPTTVEDRRARRLLWDDVRMAKERLSRSPTADLTVPLLGMDIHLTRQELERLAQPLLEQTVRVTTGVIRWASLAEGRLAGVFLVGGSSRIPLVATLLHRALSEAPVAIEQPELVVAEGSLHAGNAAGEHDRDPRRGRDSEPFPQSPVPPVAPAPPVAPVLASAATRILAPVPTPPRPAIASPSMPAAPVSPVRSQVAARVYQSSGEAPVPGPGRVAGSPGRSAVRTAAAAGFLISVPVVCAYVAFKITAGEPLLPLEIDSLLDMITG